MFFDDEDLGGLKKKTILRVPPPVPDTGWLPPASFPNLSSACMLSIDCETKEPDFDHGPGWGRGKGHIVGFSLAAEARDGSRGKWYFPVRHELETHHNLDPSNCFSWLKLQLETPTLPKIGANLLYDCGWLTEEGINVLGPLHDVQFAEALLQEEGEVALDFLGQKYLGRGKESSLMYQWQAETYGGAVNGRQRANIYRTPPRLVGHYAEDDADLPMDILKRQWALLEQEGLMDVYRMECDSIPMLIAMRRTGVNINMEAAEQLYGELAVDIKGLEERLYAETGVWANVDSGRDLAKVFDAAGIAYKLTKAGAPSFTKEFLNSVEHPIADLIREIREHTKIRNTFIKSYLLESNVNGRVHCEFHPLRDTKEDGSSKGTRSGRFASANPNLQNIPVRSKLGKRVRGLFIPDYGHVGFEKDDYSQIEYRMLMHYAVGEGAENGRLRYNQDPRTDYHVMTQELVKLIADILIERKPIKNINFGLLYGMGEPKLARQIGIAKDVAKQIFAAYHQGNPYVKATMDQASNEAQLHGFITTILGRRSRFNMWEPRQINYNDRARPLTYDLAIKNYGCDIQRCHTHKAINRRLQGSAADIIKKSMLRCWKEGVFDVIGVPKLQVHDELDFSVIDNSPQQNEAYSYMRRVLETTVPLRVPVIVESGRGPNWGAIE